MPALGAEIEIKKKEAANRGGFYVTSAVVIWGSWPIRLNGTPLQLDGFFAMIGLYLVPEGAI